MAKETQSCTRASVICRPNDLPTKCDMKTISLALLAVVSALLLGAADTNPTLLPPPVCLKDAVRIAEDYVSDKKIDVSQHYLGSVSIQSDLHGRLYWDAQWMRTERMKGGWFIVRVRMDGTAALIPGK